MVLNHCFHVLAVEWGPLEPGEPIDFVFVILLEALHHGELHRLGALQ